MLSIKSFFDKEYKTPDFIDKKQQSRRALLKSAAGLGTLAAFAPFSVNAKQQATIEQLTKEDPWLTLDATLNQLLPQSDTGPSAQDINATTYLYQLMTVQPTEQAEKEFILKGVGWLNDYAKSEKKRVFAQLNFDDKEQLLKGISQSRAGRNWLNTLLSYIFEAMLAPPAYGGNPKGVGWQWLEHKSGFPLPEKGQRYFELPPRANIIKLTRLTQGNES